MRDLSHLMPIGHSVQVYHVGGHWVVECGRYAVTVSPIVDLVEDSGKRYIAVVPEAWSVRELRQGDGTIPQELAVYSDQDGGEGSALMHAVREVMRADSARK